MKQLPLYSPSFIQAEKGFKDWLDILGYASITVYNLPHAIREFFHWLEAEGYAQLSDITGGRVVEYYKHLKIRPNIRLGGSLSSAYLNKHQQAIKKFSEYLRYTQNIHLPLLELTTEVRNQNDIDVLTVEEIKQILAVTEVLPMLKKRAKGIAFYEALQNRDKAMIAVFYGCGLRRNEGVQLDTRDINFDKGLLHVRNGKNYTERIIPVSNTNLGYLQSYLSDRRPVLLNGKKQYALFISARGARMQGQTLLIRLKWLIQLTGNPVLQQKKVGLHTLRHSIATHLLSAGMQLERIKDFLGHTSLDSTQIYTHLSPEALYSYGKPAFNPV